jgi:uncharacterized membrane protein YsdA (DUF1294 family)
MQLYICPEIYRRVGKREFLLIFEPFGTYSLIFLSWALLFSLAALIMMGVDKASAKLHKTRISENTFGLISLLGGFFGVIIGGLIFHHKTSKPEFWAPVAVAVLLWGALFLVVFHLIRF